MPTAFATSLFLHPHPPFAKEVFGKMGVAEFWVTPPPPFADQVVIDRLPKIEVK